MGWLLLFMDICEKLLVMMSLIKVLVLFGVMIRKVLVLLWLFFLFVVFWGSFRF